MRQVVIQGGDLETGKICHKYHVRPTVSMKIVNLFCYQNAAQVLLAKDGSRPHLFQVEGRK